MVTFSTASNSVFMSLSLFTHLQFSADAKAKKVSKATKLFKEKSEKAPKAEKMSMPKGKAAKAKSIKAVEEPVETGTSLSFH